MLRDDAMAVPRDALANQRVERHVQTDSRHSQFVPSYACYTCNLNAGKVKSGEPLLWHDACAETREEEINPFKEAHDERQDTKQSGRFPARCRET